MSKSTKTAAKAAPKKASGKTAQLVVSKSKKTKAVPATVETTVHPIAVADLIFSRLNVRQSGSDEAAKDMVASIRAQGVINNLVVVAQIAKGKESGKFGVIDGARRLRALRALVDAGHIPKDFAVLCSVVAENVATDISLAANIHRETMHPADEFTAFAKLAKDGAALTEIAERHGVSLVAVKRRLALQAVAPELFALFARDEMSLAQITEFARVDNHELQLQVWSSAQSRYDREPTELRRKLFQNEIDIDTDRRFSFVPLQSYLDAGGTIRRDLFAAQNHRGYATNPALLDQLLTAQLEAEAEKIRAEGVAFVHVLPRWDYSAANAYRNAPTTAREPTETEAARLAEIDRLLTELEAAGDDESDEEVNSLELERDEIDQGLDVIPDDVRALCGVLIGFNSQTGNMQVNRDVLQPGTQVAATADGAPVIADKTERAEYPQSLLMDLARARTHALQVSMLERPDVALLLLAQAMANTVFRCYRHDVALKVSATPYRSSGQPDPELLGVDDSALQSSWAMWRDRLGLADHDRDVMQSVATLNADDLIALIAFCSTVSLEVGSGGEVGQSVTQLLDLDLSKSWKPEPAFLMRLPSAQIKAIVTEVAGEAVGATIVGKKQEIVARAAPLLEQSGWLPSPFRPA